MKKRSITKLAKCIAELSREEQKKLFAKLAKLYGRQADKSRVARVMLKVAQHNCHSLEDVMRHLKRAEATSEKSEEG